MLRYGHRPRVGDTFSGGGSIPFEAARLGCDVLRIGPEPDRLHADLGRVQHHRRQRQNSRAASSAPSRRWLKRWSARSRHSASNTTPRATAPRRYLYCLETRCPETGWMVPMSTTWVDLEEPQRDRAA